MPVILAPKREKSCSPRSPLVIQSVEGHPRLYEIVKGKKEGREEEGCLAEKKEKINAGIFPGCTCCMFENAHTPAVLAFHFLNLLSDPQAPH